MTCEYCNKRKAVQSLKHKFAGVICYIEVCLRCARLILGKQKVQAQRDDLWQQERRTELQQLSAVLGDYSY